MLRTAADDEWQNNWCSCNVCGAWAPKLKQECCSCGIRKTWGTSWKPSVPFANSVPGPAANAQCAQYTLVAPATPTWPRKTPFVMSTKPHGNQSYARHASCYSSWRELQEVKANIEATIAAAKRGIALSKPLPAHLSACIAALERDTARRHKAEEVLETAFRDAEVAREEVTRGTVPSFNASAHRVCSRRVRLFITCCLTCNHHLTWTRTLLLKRRLKWKHCSIS